MRYLHRALETKVSEAAGAFPAVILTGPRRAGKTSLLKRVFTAGSYRLFEDPEVVGRFRAEQDVSAKRALLLALGEFLAGNTCQFSVVDASMLIWFAVGIKFFNVCAT